MFSVSLTYTESATDSPATDSKQKHTNPNPNATIYTKLPTLTINHNATNPNPIPNPHPPTHPPTGGSAGRCVAGGSVELSVKPVLV